MYNNSEKISASEINRYTYCPYQWYYERHYGRKYLRERYSKRNKASGYADSSKGNFKRGLEFHENYMEEYKTGRLVKVIVQIIIAAAIVLLIILVTKGIGPEIKQASPGLRIPGYKIFYTDQRCKERKKGVIYSKLLTSEKYGLYGKPDFLLRRGNNIIPVELKSGSGFNGPKQGDMMQLFAYILIAEDVYSARVPEGRLIYSDTMFIIKNTKKLRKELFTTVRQMRQILIKGEARIKVSNYNQASFARCKYCVCRGTVCERI